MSKMYQLGMVLLVVVSGALGGCQQTLFTNSDTYTRSRIDRYWERDSAVDTRASRARASEMGFGFPTGMANQ